MRRGAFIQTYSGGKFYPLDPRADEVRVEDIAHALSNLCRFAGHVERFISVAQHCVFVSHYCEPQDALWGLLHDASEAYMCDIPSPLKRDPRFAFYRMAEAQLMGVICEAFALPVQEPKSVSLADRTVLSMEARDLLKPSLRAEYWQPRYGIPPPEDIVPWTPADAESAYLERFYQLRGEEAA